MKTSMPPKREHSQTDHRLPPLYQDPGRDTCQVIPIRYNAGGGIAALARANGVSPHDIGQVFNPEYPVMPAADTPLAVIGGFAASYHDCGQAATGLRPGRNRKCRPGKHCCRISCPRQKPSDTIDHTAA